MLMLGFNGQTSHFNAGIINKVNGNLFFKRCSLELKLTFLVSPGSNQTVCPQANFGLLSKIWWC